MTNDEIIHAIAVLRGLILDLDTEGEVPFPKDTSQALQKIVTQLEGLRK